jgi:hypothetical protein
MKKLHPRMVRQHLPQFTLFLFFSAARSRCAADMPYVCSFLKCSTMPAALTLTHVLFGGVWIANVL